MKTLPVPLVLTAILWPCLPAGAQTPPATTSETDSLRAEMRQMQQDYERRMQSLEQRLQQIETAASPTNRPMPTAATAGTNPPPTLAERYQIFAQQQFGQDTESRDWARAQEQSQPIKERVQQVLNNFVDIGGYFRAGYGRDDKGGPQPAFQAPGAFAKYRLGNEAEDYGELIVGKNWYVPDLFSPDAASGRTARRPGRLRARRCGWRFTIRIRVPALPAVFKPRCRRRGPRSAMSSPAQPALKFWAGNRYYRRQDIHINDFFFYNMSGAGGGVEDLELANGKLALAWIGNGAQSGVYSSDIAALPDPNNLAGFSKQSLDLSLYEVAMPWGKGEFGLVFASGKQRQGRQRPAGARFPGVAFTFLHTHEHFLSAGRGQQVFAAIRHRRGQDLHLRLRNRPPSPTAPSSCRTIRVRGGSGRRKVLWRNLGGAFLHQPGAGLSVHRLPQRAGHRAMVLRRRPAGLSFQQILSAWPSRAAWTTWTIPGRDRSGTLYKFTARAAGVAGRQVFQPAGHPRLSSTYAAGRTVSRARSAATITRTTPAAGPGASRWKLGGRRNAW